MSRSSGYILAITLLLGQTTWFASNYHFAAYDISDICSNVDAFSSLDLDVPALSDALVGMTLAIKVVIVRFEFYTCHIRVAKMLGTCCRARAPPLVFPA